MATVKAGNVRKGMYILFKGQPHLVTKTNFVSPGKGSAFMRLKLKSVLSQSTIEFTYKSNEQVEEVEVESNRMQFLYADKDQAVFMNQRSFEQAEVPLDLIDDKVDLLTPDIEVYVLLYQGKAIGISFPPKITLTVAKAPDAVAGNTVGQAKKEVELETGFKVMAPLFVKTGDKLIIDTDTKTYVSRA